MIIKSVRITNFRSLYDVVLHCDDLTALVGRNGAGKSSFLSALEMFYEATAQVAHEDFYSEDLSKDIEITVTFSDLTDDERQLFHNYINDTTLTVVRAFSLASGKLTKQYYGERLQHPGFLTFVTQ